MTQAALESVRNISSAQAMSQPRIEWPEHLQQAWQRIQQHPIGTSPATAGLPERIAREHNWSLTYTLRAIEAYRRFCLLAVDRQAGASPSHPVDAVWHAHLLYTTDYWNVFCATALGFPLHHVPNSGAPGEGARLNNTYEQTLSRYNELFGHPAPADLWPPPNTPSSPIVHLERSKYWILPKLPKSVLALLAIVVLILIALLSAGAGPAHITAHEVAPAQALADLSIFDFSGPTFLSFYVFAYLAVFTVCHIIRHSAATPHNPTPADFTPDPYDAAYLAGGRKLALSAALTSLVARTEVISKLYGYFELPKLAREKRQFHPLESAILSTIESRSLPFRQIYERTAAAMSSFRLDLVDHGLVPDLGKELSYRAMAVLLSLSVPAIGLIKIFIGLSRDKPVSYLIALTLLTAIISLVTFTRPVRTTTTGRRLLASLRAKVSRADITRQAKLATAARAQDDATPYPHYSPGVDPLALALALYGTSILDDTPLRTLRESFDPPSSNTSSSWTNNSSSSCSTTTSSCSTGGSSDSSSSSDSSCSSSSGCGGCSSSG